MLDLASMFSAAASLARVLPTLLPRLSLGDATIPVSEPWRNRSDFAGDPERDRTARGATAKVAGVVGVPLRDSEGVPLFFAVPRFFSEGCLGGKPPCRVTSMLLMSFEA